MSQPNPTGLASHPPVVDKTEARNEQEEERDDAEDNFDLLDVQKQDTEVQEDYNPESESEKGQQSGGEKPRHVGFWSHELVNVRLHVIYLWFKTVTILFIFILLVLSLFNGVFYHIPKNYSSLIVYVVDFDGQVAPYQGTPIVGPAILQAIQRRANSPGPQLGYVTMPPSKFNNDPIAVRQAVYDFKAHAAIIVNANATALLQQAVDQGNATYDPNGAAQIIYVSARDQNTIPTYIVPQLTGLEKAITSQFGAQWAQSVMQNTSIQRENLSRAPQALSPGIGFTTYDLRPFGPANVTPAVSIGLIYLIIIAFFSFTFFMPIHMKYLSPRGHPPLHFYQLIIWRWFATTASYFLLSLAYSLVALAFQIPFSTGAASPTEVAINPTAYGKGTFVVYWMINFLGMAALGLACENVAMALGQPWTAMWLIFWVITNVCTGFYSLDLVPGFYLWGYAWPLHHVVEASHQLLFDLHSRIGLNIGVLVVWVVINTLLFPAACYLMRWEQQKAKQKEARKEQEWLNAMSRQRTKLGIPK
ncbi:hypothetical protein ACLMJK_002258 [Lecanora helva]